MKPLITKTVRKAEPKFSTIRTGCLVFSDLEPDHRYIIAALDGKAAAISTKYGHRKAGTIPHPGMNTDYSISQAKEILGPTASTFLMVDPQMTGVTAVPVLPEVFERETEELTRVVVGDYLAFTDLGLNIAKICGLTKSEGGCAFLHTLTSNDTEWSKVVAYEPRVAMSKAQLLAILDKQNLSDVFVLTAKEAAQAVLDGKLAEVGKGEAKVSGKVRRFRLRSRDTEILEVDATGQYWLITGGCGMLKPIGSRSRWSFPYDLDALVGPSFTEITHSERVFKPAGKKHVKGGVKTFRRYITADGRIAHSRTKQDLKSARNDTISDPATILSEFSQGLYEELTGLPDAETR